MQAVKAEISLIRAEEQNRGMIGGTAAWIRNAQGIVGKTLVYSLAFFASLFLIAIPIVGWYVLVKVIIEIKHQNQQASRLDELLQQTFPPPDKPGENTPPPPLSPPPPTRKEKAEDGTPIPVAIPAKKAATGGRAKVATVETPAAPLAPPAPSFPSSVSAPVRQQPVKKGDPYAPQQATPVLPSGGTWKKKMAARAAANLSSESESEDENEDPSVETIQASQTAPEPAPSVPFVPPANKPDRSELNTAITAFSLKKLRKTEQPESNDEAPLSKRASMRTVLRKKVEEVEKQQQKATTAAESETSGSSAEDAEWE